MQPKDGINSVPDAQRSQIVSTPCEQAGPEVNEIIELSVVSLGGSFASKVCDVRLVQTHSQDVCPIKDQPHHDQQTADHDGVSAVRDSSDLPAFSHRFWPLPRGRALKWPDLGSTTATVGGTLIAGPYRDPGLRHNLWRTKSDPRTG